MKDILMFTIVLGFIIGGPVACNIVNSNNKTEAIKAGVDPQIAACTYDFTPNYASCLVLATKKQEEKK